MSHRDVRFDLFHANSVEWMHHAHLAERDPLYGTGNVRAHIAKAAPVVLEAAAGGDIVAVRIVEACAGELCRLVTAVTCDLEFSDAYPLALSGGVICNSAPYRARLEAGLRSINPAPGLIRTVPKPVLGAIRIGQKLLNS